MPDIRFEVEGSSQTNFPFLTEGMVFVQGCQDQVHECILRDTGAAQCFLLEGVLPLSEHVATGTHVLVRGFEMGSVEVRLHQINLTSELIIGIVVVGVQLSPPVPGISFILGNDLAGEMFGEIVL